MQVKVKTHVNNCEHLRSSGVEGVGSFALNHDALPQSPTPVGSGKTKLKPFCPLHLSVYVHYPHVYLFSSQNVYPPQKKEDKLIAYHASPAPTPYRVGNAAIEQTAGHSLLKSMYCETDPGASNNRNSSMH